MVYKKIITLLIIILTVAALTIPCYASSVISEAKSVANATGNFIIGISEERVGNQYPTIWAWMNADAPIMGNMQDANICETRINQTVSQSIEKFNPRIKYPIEIEEPKYSEINGIGTLKYTQNMQFDSTRTDPGFRYLSFNLINYWIVPKEMSDTNKSAFNRDLKVSAKLATSAYISDVYMTVSIDGNDYDYELTDEEIYSDDYIIDTSLINIERIKDEIEVELELEHNELDKKIITVKELSYTITINPERNDNFSNAYFDIEYDVTDYTDINEIITAYGTIAPDSKDPIGYTNWLGTAVSGFFNTEILPGFTFGGILLMIISFLSVMWFLKIFAGG